MYLLHNKNAMPSSLPIRLIHESSKKVIKGLLPAVAYKPEIVENSKYSIWETDKCFTPENVYSNKPSFSMVLPPPNITGKLHLGHALACTVQDVILRRKRSLGYNVLWLPGTDHAGIATQGVVEKYLKTQNNLKREDLGREKFNIEVWKWKEQHGDVICNQLRTLGCSLDWSRQMFTMDPTHTKAVNYAFINLFHKGLIYRKKALVNWCCTLKSTVSDIEVENIEIDSPINISVPGYHNPVKFGMIYYYAYKIFDTNEELVVATTMPETMLGDTAIAVHPDDKRYSHLKGKAVIHPFTHRNLPIIFDDFVNMEFGTGAVKITPAHSKVDYDVANKHNLPLLQVIDETGRMINAGQFENLKRYECRDLLINKLDELGLLKKIISHKMALPICSRSGDIINHIPKEQWFLSCDKLNQRAEKMVSESKLKIEPEKFVKNWLNWTGDNRDWCISRQLWWGHPIPAYKCASNNDYIWIAATDEITARNKASELLSTPPENITAENDSDVLDTWFSSGIYPFAALGWPEVKSEDFKQFYPLSLMATGHDILGFWVHRMVILGLELTGQLPFKNVLLHGIVCDNKGAKMAKSKGNVIDPLDVINGISLDKLRSKTEDMHKIGILSKDEMEKAKGYHKSNFSTTNGIPECGVDALRFTLLSQDIKSHFVHFDVDLCHTNKLFCNKIWQSLKYTQLCFDKLKPVDVEITQTHLTYFDKWILSRLAGMVDKVNSSVEDYNFHTATKALKTLMYYDFCDFYLEATKPGFESDNIFTGYAHAHTLSAVLNTSLRCLAPFMIYLTDELIPKIPGFEINIICNYNDQIKKYFDFPQFSDYKTWHSKEFEEQVDKVLNTIFLVRQLKGFYGVSNKLRPQINIKTTDKALKSDINENQTVLLNLTKCGNIQYDHCNDRNFVTGVLNKDTSISVQIIADDIDNVINSARNRLQKKITKAKESISKLEVRFANDHYLHTASEVTQNLDREKLLMKQTELKQLQRLIN